MVEESIDSGNTSFLSQSYARGIRRISGKFDETQDEFALGEEIVEARKKSWAELFEKFAKATDTTELNYLTLRPVEESDESEISVRIPIRKSSAQIQHWIDTGDAPCLVLELKGSDEESISISESEAEEPDQLQSSASRSMVAALEPMDTSHERRVESGSSLSSVDTAAYIRSSANSTRGEKRPRNSDPGRLDNGKVARSMNATWPKVLVARLPESDEKGEKTVENVEILQDLEKEISRESSVPKKRKLYTGTETLFDINADNARVDSPPKMKIDRESLHPAMDSPSTFPQRKTMSFGPRLLTATWRQSRNNSITKRLTRKRSTLFRPKTPIPTRRSLRRTVKAARNSAKKRETVAPAQNEETKPNPSTEPQTSSSVGSDDVSQIIKEDFNSQIVARTKRDSRNLDGGSIFKVMGDSCEETSENRKQNMEHAKKNLYRTLLRFSDDSESTMASESNLRERIESLKKSAQPRIILHDFLDLRECCGKLERNNNEYWMQRRERNGILSNEEKKSSRENLKKKMRSERKPKSFKQNRKNIYKTRFDFATDSSNASEKPQFLEIEERNETRDETGREKVKFSNTTRNQSSFIIQSCSEDEDIFKVLTSIKPESRSKDQSDETMRTTNTLRIVSSSSETEEKPVEQIKKKKRAKSGTVRRSERKSSSKIATVSESQQIQSQYSNRSQSLVESLNGPTASKLTIAAPASTVASSSSKKKEKKAEKVNKTQTSTKEDAGRSEKRNSTKTSTGSESSKILQRLRKKLSTPSQISREERELEIIDEQSKSLERSSEKTKGVRDLPLGEAEVNCENMKDRDSKLNRKSRKTEILISNKADQTHELEINDDNDEKENKMRVNDSGMKKKISNVKKARESEAKKIENSSESDDDGSTNSSKMIGKATCNRLSTLLRYFSDESSIGDDTMIFSQKNYAGSNSIGDESKQSINSRSLRSSKKRSRKPCLTSTVVYRTKEFWETDSDHL